jgi:hypothetical protein
LKQARAFGLGVVVATQNPVDLDYKALANAGTWLVGRLQTERDKKRLADGLASASGAGLDPAELERAIGGLEPRTFLLHNVHDAKPVVFQSRWALSYLAGPMTREQIRTLAGRPPVAASTGQAAARAVPPAQAVALSTTAVPVLPPGVEQLFGVTPSAEANVYAPFVLGAARVHASLPDGAVHRESVVLLAPLSPDAAAPDWASSTALAEMPPSQPAPGAGGSFAALPVAAGKAGAVARWGKSLLEAVYRTRTITLYEARRLRLVSKPGESERDFRIRIAEATRASRDAEVDRLREKYAAKLSALEDRIRRAEQSVSREKDQASSERVQTAVSVGATLLSAFLGRRGVSPSTLGRAASSARGFDRAARQDRDVARAEESLDALKARREALARELEAELAEMESRRGAADEPLTERVVRPRKADIEITRVALWWAPMRRESDGSLRPV